MKITEIRIDGTKSLGNYENRKFGFTAVIEEGETTREAIGRTQKLLEWALNQPERDANYVRFSAELAALESENGSGDPKKLASLRAWLDKYETAKAEIEAIQ